MINVYMKSRCPKPKQAIFLAGLLVFSLFMVVHAAGLSLTQIGALNTGGATYSEWWYTATNPLLTGTAEADATVNVSVDGDSHEVTADSGGNWSYQTSIGSGDYNINISSGGDSYAFTLHAGQAMPDTVMTEGSMETTESTVSVPSTGYPQLLGLIVSSTLLGVGFYYHMYAKRNKKAYVKSVLKSLK